MTSWPSPQCFGCKDVPDACNCLPMVKGVVDVPGAAPGSTGGGGGLSSTQAVEVRSAVDVDAAVSALARLTARVAEGQEYEQVEEALRTLEREREEALRECGRLREKVARAESYADGAARRMEGAEALRRRLEEQVEVARAVRDSHAWEAARNMAALEHRNRVLERNVATIRTLRATQRWLWRLVADAGKTRAAERLP